MKKFLFAFSGGLDDVLAVHWLNRRRGHPVVALLADVGQQAPIEQVGELALECGAEGTIIVDLRQALVDDYIYPAVLAGADYENYLLATPLSRYAIARELVERAHELDIESIAHASAPHGNDQVRFEASVAALDPNLTLTNPMREIRLKTREQKIAEAKRLRLPDRPQFHRTYSVDRNLWGCGSVYGQLSNAWEAPDENFYQITASPFEAPDQPEEIVLTFLHGLPMAVDNDDLPPVELIRRVEEVAGRHGVGRLDHMENRLVGGKTREIYEAPAATVIYAAHTALEELTQSRDLNRFQRVLAAEYGRLVYEGGWFTELRVALDAFFGHAQRNVSGRVRLRLYKGNCSVIGRESTHSLYDSSWFESAEGRTKLGDLSQGLAEQVAWLTRSAHRRPTPESSD